MSKKALQADITLQVNEIFFSIQGESQKIGLPTVFIRLTGCPLRCHWCDTAYAFHRGENMSVAEICEKLATFPGIQHITVTGGEPLAQKNCLTLLQILCDLGFQVSLETSGALSLAGIDTRVMKIVDIKTPGSGEVKKNRSDTIRYLQSQDQLKFVLSDRNDYEWACEFIAQQELAKYCELLFSPVWKKLSERQLAEWILQDTLPVRLQPQLHKWLWGEQPGV